MDETDKQMIGMLAGNARIPVAVMAKKLKLARSTVQARLERLEVSGIIAGYTVRLGEIARARRIKATVLLQIEPRTMPGVMSRLKIMPEVEEAHTTSGRFDLILLLSAPTTEALDTTLDTIGAITGVKSSESLIQLSTRIDRAI